MRTFRIALALLVTSPFSSASRPQEHGPGPLVGTARFDPSAKPELEVQRARTGHLLVRPVLNGHPAGWFIFDTGAGICVISTPRAGAYELADAGEMRADGVGGSSAAGARLAEYFELGPLSVEGLTLMETDLSFLREHVGVEVEGVIGYGVLSRCVVELDLLAPRIALRDPRGFVLEKGEWTPFELDHLTPTVTATVEGREGRFHLDLGSNTGLTFGEPTVRRWNLLEGRELKDARLGGVGGSIAAKRGRVASFELAGSRLADVEATFALEATGTESAEDRAGSIGVRILESFHLTLDYPGQRICVRKRA